MALTSVLILGLLAANPSPTSSEITKAQEAFALGNFEAALKILSHAEMAAASIPLKAQTIFEQGVILEAMGNETDALVAFTRAASIHPEIQANTIELKTSVIHLFRCGRALAQNAYDAKRIRSSFKPKDRVMKCPVAIESKPAASIPAPPPPPTPTKEMTAAPPPPSAEQESNRSTWLWSFIGGGVAAFAGGAILDNTPLLTTVNEKGMTEASYRNKKLEAQDFAGASLMAIGTTAAFIGLFGNPY